jgi:hypothetical protein
VQQSTRKWEGREHTVGASEIAGCARRVWYVKHETKPDAGHKDDWGATIRGTIHESAFWEPALRAHFGKNLLFAGEEQITLKSGTISATPDGLVVNLGRNALTDHGVKDVGPSRCVVVENKTQDPRIAMELVKSAHVLQAQVQMGLFRETTKYKPDWALITVTNSSFWSDVTEHAIPFDPAIYENAKKRAWQIMAAKDAKDLKPEGWIGGQRECQYCPFAKQCGVLRTDVPADPNPHGGWWKPLQPQTLAQFIDLARQEREEYNMQCASELRQKSLQNDIKELLKANDIPRIEDADSGLKIIWSQVKGRPSWNWKALREDAIKQGFDLAKYETTGDASDRLTVQVKVEPSSKEMSHVKRSKVTTQTEQPKQSRGVQSKSNL